MTLIEIIEHLIACISGQTTTGSPFISGNSNQYSSVASNVSVAPKHFRLDDL